MRVAAIIVAAGRGERLGGGPPKQFLELAPGRSMLQMSVEAFAQSPLVGEIVVALPPQFLAEHEGRVPGVPPIAAGPPLLFVDGGERRQDSVARAFARISADADLVVIHDAARPFVSPDLIARTIEAARTHGAAIAAVQAVDTVKQAAGGAARLVAATLPRESIYLAQTPQAFRRDVLAEAMGAAADVIVTDEAMLVERAGFPVALVDGDPGNAKITTASDLAQARARLRDPRAHAMRIGTGYDLHRLVEGRALILAGVRIPFDRGLLGHSDADIVCHAVTDAVLGAAALGDIGRLFPDSDARWKDADSLMLLGAAVDRVHAAGYRIGNVDVTVVAERPKLSPHVEAMRANLARALGVGVDAVAVKGKTNEGVDAAGRGEAMACHAVALLVAAGL